MHAIAHGCGPLHPADRVTRRAGGRFLRTYYVPLLRRREMKEKVFVREEGSRRKVTSCWTLWLI